MGLVVLFFDLYLFAGVLPREDLGGGKPADVIVVAAKDLGQSWPNSVTQQIRLAFTP